MPTLSLRRGAADVENHVPSLVRRNRKHKQIVLHQSSVGLYCQLMLDVHRLRVFRSVVASGSIQPRPTTRLHAVGGEPARHRAAARDRSRAGHPDGPGIELTAAGRALAEEIDGVLARLGEVESVVGDLRAGRTGSLSIAYFASVGSAWMPEVVATMLAEFPAVRLDLSLREDVPTDPAERPDLQVAVEQGAVHRPGFVARHLLDDPYVAVLPVGHPLAGRTALDLVELAADRWVDNDFARGWCRRNLIEACHAAGFSPPFHVEAHDYPTALAFVAAGVGLTVLPRLGRGSCHRGWSPCRWSARRRCARSTPSPAPGWRRRQRSRRR